MRDMHNNTVVEVALNYGAIASDTTTVGTSIDVRDALAVEFTVQSGTVTDGTFDVLIEDSPDNSVWTAVADKNLLGTEAAAQFLAANDDEVKKIGYKFNAGNKRYVRLSLVSTGTSSGGEFSACVCKFVEHRPIDKVAQQVI
jgi:hypothetical protein